MAKKDKCTSCNNETAPQNNNYLPDCEGCEDIVPANCVVYTGPDTDCIKIPNGAYLDDIIKGLDEIICLLAEGGDYREYDFACLDYLNIQSEQQFVETISAIICEILGDQRPGNITSITELLNLINQLGNPLFTFPPCAEPLVNLPLNSNLTTVLTALRDAICLHRQQIDDLDDKVGDIENRVEVIEQEIIDINNTLEDHETRITILENAPPGILTDELVKVSPNDTTAGYLLSKFDTAGSNVQITEINNGANEKVRLTVNIPTVTDEKVKTWSGDTAGFLEGKVTSVNSAGINLVTARDGNVLKITPTLLYDQIAAQVLNLIITTPGLNNQFCQAVAACIGAIVPCDPPAELVVTEAGVDYITVQWTVIPGSQLEGYSLEYKKTTDTAYTVLNLPATASQHKITGLLPGTAYNIRIKTQCGVRDSNYTISDPNPAITSCPIPTNLNVTFS